MEWKCWHTIATYLFGAAFILTDISLDFTLFKDYFLKSRYYAECVKRLKESENRVDTMIIYEDCMKVNKDISQNLSLHEYADDFFLFFTEREMFVFWTEHELLEWVIKHEDTFFKYAIATVTWIGIGGIFQFAVAFFYTARRKFDDPFKSLPLLIRVLVLGTSPILLSPTVLYLYGIYFVTQKGVTDIPAVRIPMNNLKMAEIIFESAPQLVTQWFVFLRREWELSIVRLVSMITSTFAIAAALVNFILMKRRKIFIGHQRLTMASLVPITLWIIISTNCGMLGTVTSLEVLYRNSRKKDEVYPKAVPDLYALFGNVSTFIFTLIIIVVPSTNKRWLILRTITVLLLITNSTFANTWKAVLSGKTFTNL